MSWYDDPRVREILPPLPNGDDCRADDGTCACWACREREVLGDRPRFRATLPPVAARRMRGFAGVREDDRQATSFRIRRRISQIEAFSLTDAAVARFLERPPPLRRAR